MLGQGDDGIKVVLLLVDLLLLVVLLLASTAISTAEASRRLHSLCQTRCSSLAGGTAARLFGKSLVGLLLLVVLSLLAWLA